MEFSTQPAWLLNPSFLEDIESIDHDKGGVTVVKQGGVYKGIVVCKNEVGQEWLKERLQADVVSFMGQRDVVPGTVLLELPGLRIALGG